MHTFLQDFYDRKRQVLHYLAVVRKAEKDADIGARRVVEGRLLTLRAGTFLVLYNLVEASARGAIEAIHDHIRTSQCEFSVLRPELRREIIRLFRKTATKSGENIVEDFPAAFVALALTQEVDLAGNVDAKQIRELADSYGFSSDTKKRYTRGGSDLVTIKRNRNDLAHGRKDFRRGGTRPSIS